MTPPLRWYWFFAVGTASGLLSALTINLLHLGDVAAPEVLGYCFGLRVSSRCNGIDETFYLFPGAIFAVLFGALQLWSKRAAFDRVCGFVAASGVANAIAVFLCVWLTNGLGDALDIDFLDLPMALAGAMAGAVGAACLGYSAKALSLNLNLRRSIIAASALGLLVPLVITWEVAGVFLFYVAWQGGYAVALAANQLRQR